MLGQSIDAVLTTVQSIDHSMTTVNVFVVEHATV